MLETDPIRESSSASILLQEFDGKDFKDHLHQHKHFELVYVTRGSGSWQMGGHTGRFRAGTLLLCPPRTLHAWTCEAALPADEKTSAMVLRFSERALPPALLRLPEMSRLEALRGAIEMPLRFSVPDGERLRTRLRSVDRAQGVLKMVRFYVTLDLLAGFKFFQVPEKEEDSGGFTPRDIARVEQARRFVQERFRAPLGRSEVAAAVGLHEAAFSRFFRKTVGIPFIDYLSSLRVRHAAGLLGNRREMPLQEIARQSGFGSLAAFHRQFKKRLGTTPDSYRKAANSEFLEP